MKKSIRAIVICALLMAGCLACDLGDGDQYDFYLIKVDSIDVPDEISSGSHVDLEFEGVVGNNGCYSFSHFNSAVNGKNIDVEVWGKFDKVAQMCTQAFVNLNGRKLRVAVDEPGNYTIRVNQPDGTTFVKQFTAE